MVKFPDGRCPKCNSKNIKEITVDRWECKNCGRQFPFPAVANGELANFFQDKLNILTRGI